MRVLFFFLLAAAQALNAQSTKCKYDLDKIDDFTKNRQVRTAEEWLFENKSASILSNALFDENTSQEFYVCADYDGGSYSLLFTLTAENDAVSTEDYVLLEILLANDSIVQLYEPSNEGHDFKETNLYWRFYQPTLHQWELLKANPVKKLRFHFEDNTIGDYEIKTKYAKNLSKVITCLDNLNLPRKANAQKTKDADDDDDKTQKNVSTVSKGAPAEKVKPLGNNSAVSIHKQWKLSAQLDKEGIPKNNMPATITRFFDNGSYTTWITMPDGSTNKSEGSYQLLNDGKVIVFTYSDGKTFSGAVTKLSNTELIIKSDQFTAIYTVY